MGDTMVAKHRWSHRNNNVFIIFVIIVYNILRNDANQISNINKHTSDNKSQLCITNHSVLSISMITHTTDNAIIICNLT